uniref:U11-lycotoxin-Ls1a n=1 Tax=Lycosa singoriensis TaxID=434756 RepID=TXBJ9_LYCSI|nr:RecName: Full=U11-lycotoxin-Ls1a; AltName: Full=Toxin-like structure LSTX-J9; Flags: Precursor [Lycosa singoriensis]ACI41427.1 toxin-like structure LSTX-J9 precursor [Lycosa singoriensis]CAS03696.1 toxin-like structure LSTX-J9 precursor [Lycosa singoriensis]
MKLIILTGLVLFAIVSFIEAEEETGRACILLYGECTKASGSCCSNLICDCYRKLKKGVQIARQCFCLEKDVVYKKHI